MKVKKEMKKMASLGLNMSMNSIVLSSLPSNSISPQVNAGYSKVAGVFPAYGTLVGTGMIVDASKKLIKSSKKLKK